MTRLSGVLFLVGATSSGASWALAGWRGAVCWLLGVLCCGLAAGLAFWALVEAERQ